MAGATLLTLLDDISTVLDDVATLSKTAAQKTTGVLGDDLALNAEQVSGVKADRELPVVWGVFKGSLLNKAIIVPAALGISAVAPAAITPLLMIGGTYLCYEGVEKVMEFGEKWWHKRKGGTAPAIEVTVHDHTESALNNALTPSEQLAAEKKKIKGAVKTDFILSAEIVVIALGTVAAAPLLTQAAVLSAIGVGMTAGVYGLVAGIVKADDVGLWLMKKKDSPVVNKIGESVVNFMPKFMKGLTVVGTGAMFAVGGSIMAHGVHAIAEVAHGASWVTALGIDLATGVTTGALAVGAMHFKDKIVSLFKREAPSVKTSHEVVEPDYQDVLTYHPKTEMKPSLAHEHKKDLAPKKVNTHTEVVGSQLENQEVLLLADSPKGKRMI